MTAHKSAPVEIGIVCDEGSLDGCIHGLTDMLLFADSIARERMPVGAPATLRVTHFRAAEQNIVCAFDTLPSADHDPRIVVLVGNRRNPIPCHRASPYVPWLREHHARGATIAAICGGVFLLAETGLLDGRQATTHWKFGDELQRRFPRVLMESTRMLVDHGDIVTAGGVMAWIDMGLHLAERLLGKRVMLETARFMVLDPPRHEQSFYSEFIPRLDHGDAAIVVVQKWMNTQRERALSIEQLARRARLEPRTFLRRFLRATGLRPTEYHHHVRMARARELLEFSLSTVDQVALSVGYEAAGGFRRVFKRIVGQTPSDYRRRFLPPAELEKSNRRTA